jgi:hypothetical protein
MKETNGVKARVKLGVSMPWAQWSGFRVLHLINRWWNAKLLKSADLIIYRASTRTPAFATGAPGVNSLKIAQKSTKLSRQFAPKW